MDGMAAMMETQMFVMAEISMEELNQDILVIREGQIAQIFDGPHVGMVLEFVQKHEMMEM